MPYQFDNNLKTGHATIDGEHKLIIDVINETLADIERGAAKEEILETVKILTRYVNTHFPNEETLQEKYQYPNITFHKMWHKCFVQDMNAVSSRILTEGISGGNIAELKLRLEILVQHIMLEDVKVARHIQTLSEISDENSGF